jgi:hypothetical protein
VKEEISGKELEMGLVDDLSAQVAALEAELAALQMSLGERCQEVSSKPLAGQMSSADGWHRQLSAAAAVA